MADNYLDVLSGTRAGERVELPEGRSFVGRLAKSELEFADAGVSRTHAQFDVHGEVVTLLDLGSTNGTTVNGAPLGGLRELAVGDIVGFGAARARVGSNISARTETSMEPADGGSDLMRARSANQAAPADATTARRVSLARVLLIGALSQLVAVAVGVLISTVTQSESTAQWFAAPVVGMLASLFDVAKQAGQTPASVDTTPRAQAIRRRRTPVTISVLLVVVVIGGFGTLGVVAGVNFVATWFTGDEPGEPRLVEAPPGSVEGLTTTVTAVKQGSRYINVSIQLENTRSAPVIVSAENALLLIDSGRSLKPHAFSWLNHFRGITVPGGQTVSDNLSFEGQLPEGGGSATLTVTDVIFENEARLKQITVSGIVIGPAPSD